MASRSKLSSLIQSCVFAQGEELSLGSCSDMMWMVFTSPWNGHKSGIPNEVSTANVEPPDHLTQFVLPIAYARLRAVAEGQRRRMPVQILNTTVLLNEAFLRLPVSKDAMDGEHLFAPFVPIGRNTLIDHIRARRSQKRDAPIVSLAEDAPIAFEERDMNCLLAIDEALTAIRTQHARLVQVVEMRFFAGFENQEIAELLGVTEKTVRCDWLHARAPLAEVLDDN